MDDRKVTIEFSFRSILWVLALIASVWLAFELKDILVALLLSFILATALSPIIDYLQDKKIPRPLSITILYLMLIGMIYSIIRIVIPPFIHQVTMIYANRVEYVNSLASYMGPYRESFRITVTKYLDKLYSGLSGTNLNGIYNGAVGVLGGILAVIVVFVLSFYFLLSRNGMEKLINGYVPKKYQKRSASIFRKISVKMSYWLRGQIFLGLIIFAVDLVGLSLLGVNYALALAVISGIFEIVPVIGPWIAGILAVLIAFTQSPALALVVAAYYILIQQLENHIIVPQVMKKSLGINPVVVILAILIGGKLLGIVGILISVPVASALAILIEEFIKIKETEEKVGN